MSTTATQTQAPASIASSSVAPKLSMFNTSPGVRLGTVGLPELTEKADTAPKSTWSSYFNPLSYSYNPVNLFRSRAPASASEAPATPVAPATTSVTGTEKQSEADTAATKSTWGQTIKSAINPMTYVNYLTPSYFKAKPPGEATPASQSASEVASSAAVTEPPQSSFPQRTFSRLRSMYKTRAEPGQLGGYSDTLAAHSTNVLAHVHWILGHGAQASPPSMDEFTAGFLSAVSLMAGCTGADLDHIHARGDRKNETDISVGKTDIGAESAVSAAPPAEAATESGRASVAPTDVTIPNTKV